MKNTIKLIGIIAVAAIMSLGVFTSCELPQSSLTIGDGVKTTITITNLNLDSKYKYAFVWINDTDDVTVAASPNIKALSGTSITFDMADFNDLSTYVSLEGTGYVGLKIGEQNTTASLNSGIFKAIQASIKPGANSLNYADFVE